MKHVDSLTQSYFENLEAKDKDVQFEAFNTINAAIKEEVDWAYEVWDQLKEWLTDTDNHRRSRGAQFLAGLAKSDPEKRILKRFFSVMGSDQRSEICYSPTQLTIDMAGRISWKGTKRDRTKSYKRSLSKRCT